MSYFTKDHVKGVVVLEFSVMGPFNVPVYKHEISGIRQIDVDLVKDFWLENEAGEKAGVYIFAKKASKGYVPLYVGKTTRSFSKEAFNHKNINSINTLYHNMNKFTLVMFLICHPDGKKLDYQSIDEVETTLIQYGLKANSNLLNSKKTKLTDSWGINGVLRCGRASDTSKKLKRCFNIS